MQIIINSGKRSVLITVNGDVGSRIHARLYVNCTGPLASGLGDATLMAKSFKSRAGAERWAAQTLAAGK